MVSAFTSENIGAFGPLILTATLFMILGAVSHADRLSGRVLIRGR